MIAARRWLPKVGLLLWLAMPRSGVPQTCTATLSAGAGSCTVGASTTLTIGDVMRLTLSSVSTALTAPAAGNYDAGFVANAGPTATVQSNRAWRLQISAAAATWTASNTEPGVTARSSKPAGDLQWSTAAGGPFSPLTVTAATAASARATAATANSFFFHTLWTWTQDTPGAYSLAVVFTLVAP